MVANAVSVEVVARDRNVSAVLKGVSDALGQSAEGMRTSFRGLGSESDTLFGKLKDLRGEARQHERVFAYYGNQIASVTGLTKGFGSELAGLGIALGSGMWIAGAVAAVKLLTEEISRQTEWENRLRDVTTKVSQDLTDAWERVRLKIEGVTVAQKAFNEEFKQHSPTVKAAREELEKYEGEFKGLAYWWHIGDGYVKGLRDRIDALNQAMAIQNNQADIAAALAQEQAKAAQGPAGDKIIAKDQDTARAAAAALRIQRQKEETAALLEGAKEREKAEQQEAETEEMLRQKQIDRAKEAAKAIAEAEKKKEQAVEHFAATASREIAAVIMGQKSMAEVVKDVAKSILQTLLQAAIKQITTSALVGGAKAAEANAWFPPLAAASMASMMALIMAQMGGLPSARGGWDVTHDTLAFVHQDEKVLSAETSRKIDAWTGGGGQPQIIIQAQDAQSFEEFLRRKDNALLRVLDEFARDGRLASVLGSG